MTEKVERMLAAILSVDDEGPVLDVPDEQRIKFRVGINLGDIIIDGDDIQGDGVNIAARLEQIAEPGGIVLSGRAFDHAKNKVDVGFEADRRSASLTQSSRMKNWRTPHAIAPRRAPPAALPKR
jgi:class 3 adenylate cyclase